MGGKRMTNRSGAFMLPTFATSFSRYVKTQPPRHTTGSDRKNERRRQTHFQETTTHPAELAGSACTQAIYDGDAGDEAISKE